MRNYIPQKGPDVLDAEPYQRALWLARDYFTGRLPALAQSFLDKPERLRERREDICTLRAVDYSQPRVQQRGDSPTERKGIALALLPDRMITAAERAAMDDCKAVEEALSHVRPQYVWGLTANIQSGTAFPNDREGHSMARRQFLKEIAAVRGYISAIQ